MMKKVSVSILSCDSVLDDLEELDETDVDYIHVDSMDGKFVDNKNNPYHYLKEFCKYSKKPLDVHLMEIDPRHSIEKYASLNTEMITIHLEIQEDISSLLNLIHSYGIKAGLAISPDTDIELLDPYFDEIDLILVMSVYPGYGGQKFIASTVDKVKQIKKKFIKQKKDILISVDGGVALDEKLILPDADILVSGSYIVKSSSYQDKITSLR